MPGGGGAPEIATHCGEIFITMALSPRAFVSELPFITSFGHGDGPDSREALGVETKGPTRVITDLCVMQPDPAFPRADRHIPASGRVREQVVRRMRLAVGICGRCRRDPGAHRA